MNRIGEIEEEVQSREMRKKQIELFLRMFERQEADVEFDAGAFAAMVEKGCSQDKKQRRDRITV